jgi:hypothetical protein
MATDNRTTEGGLAVRFNIVTDSNTAMMAQLRPVTWNTEVHVYPWGEYGDVTTTGPCGSCGEEVEVVESLGYYARRRYLFCSQACRAQHSNRLVSERGAWRREKVCVVCSKEFTAKRADTKTCSSACRQKAYRQRKKAATSTNA